MQRAQATLLGKEEQGEATTRATTTSVHLGENMLTLVGMLLLLYSSYSFFYAIINSFIFYAVLGFVLVMNFSPSIRRRIISRLPRILRTFLYKASLLDVIHSMSTFVHSFAALGATSLLQRDDLYELAQALPADYAYVHQEGLVNLLPAAMRNMLVLERGEDGERDFEVEDRHGHVEDDNEQVDEDEAEEFFSFQGVSVPIGHVQGRVPPSPVRRIVASAGGASTDAAGTSSASAVSVGVDGATVTVLGRLVNGGTRPVDIAAARSSPVGTSFSHFEDAARRVGARYAASFMQQAQGIMVTGARYVFTGGSASDLQLVSATVGLSVAGVTCRTLVANSASVANSRRPLGAGGREGTEGRLGFVTQALSFAAPLCFGVASTTGGMLVIRTLVNGGVFAAIYDAGVSVRPLQILLTSFRTRMRSFLREVRGMQGQALGIAVTLSTLLILLSWRLRARLRQWGWVMQVIVQKLQSGSKQAWDLLLSEL